MIQAIHFPSVMAIGWIPYYKLFSAMPSNNYHVYATTKKKQVAFDMLFFSGNDTPAEEIFRQSTAFTDHLKKKDYRGALMLHDVVLNWDKSKGTGTVNFKPLLFFEQIGYTPYRNSFMRPMLRSKKIRHYAKGRGVEVKPSWNPIKDGAIITHEVMFRIGRFGNLAGRLLTGQWAPYVWMRIDYQIKSSGDHILSVEGSSIPNQLFYKVETQGIFRRYYHNMETNTLSEIDSFLTTGSAKASRGHLEVMRKS